MPTVNPAYVQLGTINSGATPIQADVSTLGSDVAVAVTLTTDYTTANPRPVGFPIRPGLDGVAPGGPGETGLDYPGRVFSSGTTLKVLRCEANALVTAGAATLA